MFEFLMEFIMEYSPFPTVFAGTSLEEYAWMFYAMFSTIIEYSLSITGEAMYCCLATSDGSALVSLADIFGDLMSNVEDIYIPAMASLGMAIAVVFWLIGFIEMVAEDRMSPEMFMKSFAKLAVSIGLCTYASDIAKAIRAFGDALASKVKELTSSLQGATSVNLNLDEILDFDLNQILTWTDTNGNSIDLEAYAKLLATENEGWNFLGVFGYALAILPVIFLVCLVMIAVCFIVQATRIIEMGVRATFLPIAFGLIADDGWRGAGGRYIKKYLALCSQSAVLIIIGKITCRLMTSTMNVTLNGGVCTSLFMYSIGTLLVVAVGIACVSVMFKSIGFINDVFGA